MPRRSSRRPRTTRTRRWTDVQIIAALREKKGCVHLAACALGCSPSTIYDRVKESTEVTDCRTHEDGKVDDVAEMVVYRSLLSDPELAFRAAMHRLNTKAKHRGYSTKTEVEVREGKQLELIVEIVDAPIGNDSQDDPAAPGPT